MGIGHAQSEHEGQHQRRHDAEQRRHLNREIGRERRARIVGQHGLRAFEQRGKDRAPHQIGSEARKKREGIGQRRRNGQQPPGVLSQIGDARRHQTEDQQRNDEREELSENIVERQRDARRPFGKEKAVSHAQPDGQYDARQQSEPEFHRRMIFVKIGNIFRIRTLPPAAGLGAGPQTDLSGARNGNDAFRKGATGFPDDSGSGRGRRNGRRRRRSSRRERLGNSQERHDGGLKRHAGTKSDILCIFAL